MYEQFEAPTLRVKAETDSGYIVINRNEFDHDAHELFDKKDKPLVPPRPKRVELAEAADVEDLRNQLGEALDRALEAESERDEMKARAEAAEKALAATVEPKKSGK